MTMLDNQSPIQSPYLRNLFIVLVAICLSVTLFLGFHQGTVETTLDVQAAKAVPLNLALSNGKPTLLEFYANWCTSCQAMAPTLGELKKEYDHNVNFVMLNVDNTKWLPEILRYDVEGIPHFVYLNQEGEAIAQTIGEQPRSILQADLEALIASAPLPYAHATGKISEFQAKFKPNTNATEPRSHGQPVD